MPADLSIGYNERYLHESGNEHIDSLLRTIMEHEKTTGKPVSAEVITWRGMMTKFLMTPYKFDEEVYVSHLCQCLLKLVRRKSKKLRWSSFEMNATRFQVR